MINKYKPNGKDLREYKANKVKQGTAKNGHTYTVFTINDKITREDGSTFYENYSVFSWQPDMNLKDGDKITFREIKSLEVKTREYNGNKYVDKTIFADINVIVANPADIQVVGDLPNLADIDSDSLPF